MKRVQVKQMITTQAMIVDYFTSYSSVDYVALHRLELIEFEVIFDPL